MKKIIKLITTNSEINKLNQNKTSQIKIEKVYNNNNNNNIINCNN